MKIVFKMDIDGYTPEKLVELLEEGVITPSEIKIHANSDQLSSIALQHALRFHDSKNSSTS